MVIQYTVYGVICFGSCQVFDERSLLHMFLQDSFHVGVRQRRPKLFSRTILDVYLRIKVINKGLPIVQKNCDRLHTNLSTIITPGGTPQPPPQVRALRETSPIGETKHLSLRIREIQADRVKAYQT